MASMPECALTRCYGLTSSGSSVARAAEHRCQDVPPALPQEREPKRATDPPPRHSRQEPTPTGTELECWAHDEDSAGTADGGCFWASRTVRRAAPGAQRLRTIEDHAPTVTHHAPGLDLDMTAVVQIPAYAGVYLTVGYAGCLGYLSPTFFSP